MVFPSCTEFRDKGAIYPAGPFVDEKWLFLELNWVVSAG
jgi:hypothetical protein